MKRIVGSSLFIGLLAGVLASLGCAGADEGSGETELSGEIATHAHAQRHIPWPAWRRAMVLRDGGMAGATSDAGESTSGAGSTSGGATSSGGSTSGGSRAGDSSADCDVCAKAQACCTSVNAGALCTFSAATCEALETSAKAAYVNDCKVLINTVLSVRSAAPTACE